MGLLDALFSQDSFGGQGGGLLDLIRSTQAQNSQYQPGMGFGDNQPSPLDNAPWPAGPGGAPSAPATFADRFSALPGAPGAFNPAPRQMDASNFDPATFAPNQAQPIQVGSNYQMPRLGGADQFQPQQAMLPPNAQPAQGQMPTDVSSQGRQPQQPQELPPAFGGTSYLERVNAGGGLIGSMLGDTSQQKNLTAQYHALRQALTSNGESPQAAASKAMIATMNPEAAKTIIPELFTSKQEYKTEKDALGAEHGFWIDKINQTKRSADTEGGGSGGIGAPQVLAPGVAKYDPSLTGEQYFNQFGPEVKAAIKAQINGDVMPTGNPRMQAMASVSKTFAAKYAQDMGIPFSDALYAEKRKLKTDLASSNNSSLGGILSNGESSFSHLAEAGQSMADLGNTSHNFPLGGYLAHGQNYLGNALGGSDTQGKVKALNNNLGRYGQESTKFYAGSGGGVEERTAARKEMNAETTSSEEYASYLEKEKSLMVDRLKSKFDQIRQTLGEEEAQRVIAKHTPDIQKNIEKIDTSIAKLRGEKIDEKATANPNIDALLKKYGGK